MADSDDMAGGRQSLLRIADILGIAPDAFFHGPDEAANGPPSTAEEAELLGLFRAMGCVRSRRRCLDLVRALAPDRRVPTGAAD